MFVAKLAIGLPTLPLSAHAVKTDECPVVSVSESWKRPLLPRQLDLLSMPKCKLKKFRKNITATEFRQRYSNYGKAFVLSGFTEDWPARKSWTRHSFVTKYGRYRMPLKSTSSLGDGYRSGTLGQISVDDFMSLNESVDVLFHNDYSPLADALNLDMSIVAPLAWIEEKPIISLGGIGSGVAFHNHDVSWLAQILGRKVWWTFKNKDARTGSHDFFVKQPCHHLIAQTPRDVDVCIAREGDIVYLPPGIFHATCNLDDFTLGVGAEGAARNWQDAHRYIARNDIQALTAWLSNGGVSSTTFRFELLGLAVRADRVNMLDLLCGTPLEIPKVPEDLLGTDWPIIHEAAFWGKVASVQRLLELRANPNERVWKRPKGRTPMHMAAEVGSVETLELLVKSRGKLKLVDEYKATPIFYAAKYGHIPTVEWLVKSGLEADVPDSMGFRPIHDASRKGKHVMVEFLLTNRAGINSPGENNFTPLHYAAMNDHILTVKLLLESGADPKAVDSQNRCARAWAEHKGYVGIVSVLDEFLTKH